MRSQMATRLRRKWSRGRSTSTLAGIWVWLHHQAAAAAFPQGTAGCPVSTIVTARATETVDVGASIDGVAVECLLGSQIIGRAEHVFVVSDRQRGLLAIRELGQPQIEDFDRALEIDQQIVAGLMSR